MSRAICSVTLATLISLASAWQSTLPGTSRATTSRIRSTVRLALPTEVQNVVDNRFRKEYPTKELETLWKVLKDAYGSEANALQAVVRNPTILNPAYTSPPSVVKRSKAALVDVLGKEDALDVMLKNPAVLQCGETLRAQPADQIKRFASIRAGLDTLPANAPTVFLSVLTLLIGVVIAGKRGALPEEASGLVQGLGQLLAVFGVTTTVSGAILQNVAETGRPSAVKSKDK